MAAMFFQPGLFWKGISQILAKNGTKHQVSFLNQKSYSKS